MCPGFDYADEILEAIEGARAVVLLLSESANASRFVRGEIERAVSIGRPVVPFRLREVLPSRGLALFVSGTQWIDAWTAPPEEQLRKLTQAVRLVAGLPAPDRQPHRQEAKMAAPPAPGAAAPVSAATATVTPGPPEPTESTAPERPPRRRWRWVAAVAAGLAAIGVAAVTGQLGGCPAEPPVEVIAGTFPQPQSVFRDRTADGSSCPDCPEMVVVPAGSFTMGSPEGETTREEVPADYANRERPQHRVTIGSALAVGICSSPRRWSRQVG